MGAGRVDDVDCNDDGHCGGSQSGDNGVGVQVDAVVVVVVVDEDHGVGGGGMRRGSNNDNRCIDD